MKIEVEHLHFAYAKQRPVLRDLTFGVQQGAFVCLLGPNGVGKSTLFRCMLGLLPRYQGRICVDGADLRTLTPAQMARRVAYIPQTTQHTFSYPVRDVVLMGTTSQISPFAAPGVAERQHVERALANLGIGDLRDRMFASLSGGEKQLVLIARALVQKAKILFMDEPTANLDYGNQVRVLEKMKQLTEQGYTILQSTHNPEQAFLYADQVLAVAEGGVVADGPPRAVLNEALLQRLYGVEVCVESFHNDAVRICVPGAVLGRVAHNPPVPPATTVLPS